MPGLELLWSVSHTRVGSDEGWWEQSKYEPIIQDSTINLPIFSKANAEEKQRALWHIQQNVTSFSDQALRDLIRLALDDPNFPVRAEACYLIEIWSVENRLAAAYFEVRVERLSQNDPSKWVKKNAVAAAAKFSPVQGAWIDLELFAVVGQGRKILALQEISRHIADFDTPTLQILIDRALRDSDQTVRTEACLVVGVWSDVDKFAAAYFGSQIAFLVENEWDSTVRAQANETAKKISIVKESDIDLALFAVADVHRKLQAVDEISAHLNHFDLQTLKNFIDHALHDPEPEVRGEAARLLATCTSVTSPWKWIAFEPYVHQMAFHDPDTRVCIQSVDTAIRLYWPAFFKRWLTPIITCWILVGLIGITIVPALANWSFARVPLCDPPSAQVVFEAAGTQHGNLALGLHNGRYASIGLEENSRLVLDMGASVPLIDRGGVDFYYYERPAGVGIYLDATKILVAPDNGSGAPNMYEAREVFVWGDSVSTNNGMIPPEYFANGNEEPNVEINSAQLYNGTGVGIDIAGPENWAYRFVIIQPFPPELAVGQADLLAETDAIEVVCPPPSLTPTPTATAMPSETPTDTPSPTVTMTPSETPTDTPSPTVTMTPSETPTDTPSPTVTMTPGETPTDTPSPTVTMTPSETPTDTPLPTATMTPSETPTDTPSPTATMTPSETPTDTPSPTVTMTPSETATDTPAPTSTATSTTTRTSSPTPTHTATSTPTSTTTRTPSPTFTHTPRPTPTYTLRPTRTRKPIATPWREPLHTPSSFLTLTPTTQVVFSVTPAPIHTLVPISSPISTRPSDITPSVTPVPTNTSTTIPTTGSVETPIAPVTRTIVASPTTREIPITTEPVEPSTSTRWSTEVPPPTPQQPGPSLFPPISTELRLTFALAGLATSLTICIGLSGVPNHARLISRKRFLSKHSNILVTIEQNRNREKQNHKRN